MASDAAVNGGADAANTDGGDGDGGRFVPVVAGFVPVVTAFVWNSAGEVLLVRRSDGVRTYPRLWGGVSGSIEASDTDAMHRALAELSEEVGLSPSDVSLQSVGRLLPIADGDNSFMVHPLGFSLRSDELMDKIRLNWEASEYTWADPATVCEMDAVPELWQTLCRVRLPSEAQREFIRRLVEDREHGAAELADWVWKAIRDEAFVGCIYGAFEGSFGYNYNEWQEWETIQNMGYQVATCRPSMAPIANTAAEVLRRAKQEFQKSKNKSVAAAVESAAVDFGDEIQRKLQALVEQSISLLKDGMTVFTISYSSTIAKAILCASTGDGCTCGSHAKVKVIIPESRPLNEGVRIASTLAEEGVDVTVVTDAQAMLFVQQADIILTGADSVTYKGVVNKVGTHAIALAAQQAGIPMYAIATTTKISPGPTAALVGSVASHDYEYEEKAIEEVTRLWDKGIDESKLIVRNIYYECTPLSLFSGIVTEEGVLGGDDISKIVDRRKRGYVEAFDLSYFISGE